MAQELADLDRERMTKRLEIISLLEEKEELLTKIQNDVDLEIECGDEDEVEEVECDDGDEIEELEEPEEVEESSNDGDTDMEIQ